MHVGPAATRVHARAGDCCLAEEKNMRCVLAQTQFTAQNSQEFWKMVRGFFLPDFSYLLRAEGLSISSTTGTALTAAATDMRHGEHLRAGPVDGHDLPDGRQQRRRDVRALLQHQREW